MSMPVSALVLLLIVLLLHSGAPNLIVPWLHHALVCCTVLRVPPLIIEAVASADASANAAAAGMACLLILLRWFSCCWCGTYC